MARTGFGRGIMAALIMGLAMVLGRAILGVPSLPEVLVDLTTRLLPLTALSFLLQALEGWAKPLLIAILAAGQLLAGGVLGVIGLWGEVRLRRRASPLAGWGHWGYSLTYSVLLYLLAMIALLPAAERGFFGAQSGGLLSLWWLIYFVAYGGSLAALSPRPGAPTPTLDRARRRLLGRLGMLTLGMALSAFLGRFIWMMVAKSSKKGGPSLGQLRPEITSNQDFYTVSKNFVNPRVDASTWQLTITGLVEKPLTLSHRQFLARPAVTQFLTLECISNEVGGDLIGNAQWKGVPLGKLLWEAGVRGGVRKVVLFAADQYSDSITLEKAMEPGTIIAYEMNGVPLSDEHGFPARLLVPGIFGMKNVKWLTRIELVDYDYQGYWQRREWSDTAGVKTTSQIDVPQGFGDFRREEIEALAGIAFAGDRGIARVEVSTNRGQTWAEARVKEALSPFTWVLWIKQWSPPAPGQYTIMVRATDGTGELQSPYYQEPLPEGATGYDSVVVRIVA